MKRWLPGCFFLTHTFIFLQEIHPIYFQTIPWPFLCCYWCLLRGTLISSLGTQVYQTGFKTASPHFLKFTAQLHLLFCVCVHTTYYGKGNRELISKQTRSSMERDFNITLQFQSAIDDIINNGIKKHTNIEMKNNF